MVVKPRKESINQGFAWGLKAMIQDPFLLPLFFPFYNMGKGVFMPRSIETAGPCCSFCTQWSNSGSWTVVGTSMWSNNRDDLRAP